MNGEVMAKQIEGVYDRILQCAKKEFLEKGFKGASLRVIAKEANTSTGSIYTRFKDKDGLFCAIVNPMLEEVQIMANQQQNQFNQFDAKKQEAVMAEYTMKCHDQTLDFIYDHEEEFILLLNKSYGSSLENFMDGFIEIEEMSTLHYLQTIGKDKLLESSVTKDFIHILATTYCYGLFEPLLHHMSRENAHEFKKMFKEYHKSGFNALFGNK